MFTQSQIDQFHHDGTIIAKNLIKDKELKKLQEAADKVVNKGIENEISISNEGFEYIGDGPKTPQFHWETLTNKIDPERRKSLKALDIVPK